MTRIGLAYNQKPDTVPAIRDDVSSRGAEESHFSPGGTATLSAVLAAHSRRSGTRISDADAPFETPDFDGVAVEADDEFAEWDSAETIGAVERALAALGEVVRIEATDDFPERLRTARPDIVFNIAEGLRGPNRESHIPAICEFYGIPYTASDPYTLSLCLDKARTKDVLRARGVPTAPSVLVESVVDLGDLPAFPVFAKPVHEGSSKGITERNFCRDRQELAETVSFLLERYAQPVIVEAYLPGAEFTCAVLGNGHGARVLPLVGLNFSSLPDGALPIYGFEAKWVWDRPERPLAIFECPARISAPLAREIERVTLAAYRALGCRDWSRIDVRLDAKGAPNVVEVNPLPGILPDPQDNSCFPKAARAAGISYEQLIQHCLRLAAERQGIRI